MTLAANARYYTDLSGLGDLRRQARQDPNAARTQVAREFEAMFVQMMLERMREAMPATEDEYLGQGGALYRDLLDKQVAIEISKAGGIGFARQIESSLGGRETPTISKPAGPDGNGQQQSTSLRMPEVPDAAAREHAASQTLMRVQQSLEMQDPFNGRISGRPAAPEPIQIEEAAPGYAITAQPANRFQSPEHFVKALHAEARTAAAALGTAPDVLLAQAALETGWGRHLIHGQGGRPSYNLFGIKADARWQGPTVEVTTTEYRHGHAVREQAKFRAYASYGESFRDYVAFLQGNPRYSKALALSDRPQQFMQALQQAGYATDPQYASKVTAVMRADAFAAGSARTTEIR
ncbi:MAG TPA: flagellar assembly peptidoglycan hydrolase FlgJ [Gammaproteobacteria bacterium]|nr:flagellar assembly peptidoglycan hydrolase FlgJ [Gammaproteobacteria bacterium]